MAPKAYWNMCYGHISDKTFYNNLDNNDPSTIVQDRVNKFAEKYKSILKNNEYEFLTFLNVSFLNVVIKYQIFTCSLNYINQRK